MPDGVRQSKTVGDAIATYQYDAFGVVRNHSGPASTEFGFAGQQEDPTLGYQYLRARYYDPTIGRFISRDPVGGSEQLPQTLNRYSYATNNPALLTDSTGLSPYPLVIVRPKQACGDSGEGLGNEPSSADMLLMSAVSSNTPASVGAAGLLTAFRSLSALKSAWGSGGPGQVWHHIVERRLAETGRFPAELIHSAKNVVAVSQEANQAIANYYRRIRDYTGGQTVRKWLESQPFDDQLEFGHDILGRVLNGLPLP